MTRDESNQRAVRYFHENIERFDDIYNENKKSVSSILNSIIRASVKARFDLAFDVLGDLTGKSVLDIGCGSGRYMFRAAENNAGNIVGIDAAKGALQQARKIAGELKIDSKLEFIEADFLDCAFNRKFDVIFAVGYFDYIFNPLDHLKKMTELSDGFIYISFPKIWSIFTLTRKIRLALKRCPVRFYSKSRIEKLLHDTGMVDYDLKKVYRDYIVIFRK